MTILTYTALIITVQDPQLNAPFLLPGNTLHMRPRHRFYSVSHGVPQEYLVLRTKSGSKVVTSRRDLRGVVSIKTQESALSYARLWTSPLTSYIFSSDIYEIWPIEKANGAYVFHVGRMERILKSKLYQVAGLVPSDVYRQFQFQSFAKAVPAGWLVQRPVLRRGPQGWRGFTSQEVITREGRRIKRRMKRWDRRFETRFLARWERYPTYG